MANKTNTPATAPTTTPTNDAPATDTATANRQSDEKIFAPIARNPVFETDGKTPKKDAEGKELTVWAVPVATTPEDAMAQFDELGDLGKVIDRRMKSLSKQFQILEGKAADVKTKRLEAAKIMGQG